MEFFFYFPGLRFTVIVDHCFCFYGCLSSLHFSITGCKLKIWRVYLFGVPSLLSRYDLTVLKCLILWSRVNLFYGLEHGNVLDSTVHVDCVLDINPWILMWRSPCWLRITGDSWTVYFLGTASLMKNLIFSRFLNFKINTVFYLFGKGSLYLVSS